MAEDSAVPAKGAPPVHVHSEALLEAALAQIAATKAVQAELIALRRELDLARLTQKVA